LPFGKPLEYREGNRVTIGTLVNGKFVGSHKREVRDEQGKVREEVWDNEKGEVTSRHVYTNGPFGKIKDDFNMNGELFNTTTFEYDEQGNVTESNVYMPDGSRFS
jgi:antitoxin component YwqK of YwqJK toxin-antitoxin module